MAKQPPKKLKHEPASPPPGATSESVVQPTATTPLFPEPPLSPQSRRRTGMIRMDLLQFCSLMKSFGITDWNFLNPLYSQLIEADGFGGDEVEFAVAVIKSVNPRDSLEAMLAAQMAVMHWATMKFMRQVGDERGTQFQELAVTTATKVARVFGAQMEIIGAAVSKRSPFGMNWSAKRARRLRVPSHIQNRVGLRCKIPWRKRRRSVTPDNRRCPCPAI